MWEVLGDRPDEDRAARMWDDAAAAWAEGGGVVYELDQGRGEGHLIKRWEFFGLTAAEAVSEALRWVIPAERPERDPSREVWWVLVEVAEDGDGFDVQVELWYP
jgi:hypothetical protein